MLLLLDTDIFAYQATTSAETEVDLGGDIWSLTMDMQQAKDTFEAAVDSIKARLETNDVLCCMSDHAGNFRKQVWPGYKSNRRKTRKPVGYVAFCDWVRETYSTASRPHARSRRCHGHHRHQARQRGQGDHRVRRQGHEDH